MTVVVGLSAIVRKEAHAVTLCNVLRVALHPFLGAVPERRDSLNIFVQTEDKRVLLLVLGHERERIVCNVAEKLNRRLNTPVPLVIQHQGVSEEKARLVATHVTIRDTVTVDDLFGGHVGARLCSLVLIDKVGERPMLFRDLAILGLARSQSRSDLFELIVKGLIVQEDPVVVIGVVEAILDLTDGASNLPYIAVSGKGDKSGVHPRAWSCRSKCG